MSRREALLSAGAVFLVALVVRAWAATQITFPRPEDVAYYVGVARNLVEGRGLTTDAIWSFQTPPLSFPRAGLRGLAPAAVVPRRRSRWRSSGTTFAAAQVVIGHRRLDRLRPRVAARRGRGGRARDSRSVARERSRSAPGSTAAVYLPLVLASVQPDSTMPFAALVLVACLLMTRLSRRVSLEGVREEGIGAFVDADGARPRRRSRVRVRSASCSALAALTRNEAIWLALTFAIIEWSNVRGGLLAAVRTGSAPGASTSSRVALVAHPHLRAVGVPRLARRSAARSRARRSRTR